MTLLPSPSSLLPRPYLRVTLRAQRPALEHRELIEQTPLIHVEAGVDVIQGRAHARQLLVKVVVEDALRVWDGGREGGREGGTQEKMLEKQP